MRLSTEILRWTEKGTLAIASGLLAASGLLIIASWAVDWHLFVPATITGLGAAGARGLELNLQKKIQARTTVRPPNKDV